MAKPKSLKTVWGAAVPTDSPHTDKEWLKEKYYEQGLTLSEIGDIVDRSQTAIANQMEKHGLERRGNHGVRQPRATYYHLKGYPIANSGDDDVRIHRLLYAAYHGTEALRDKDVHHKNGVRWDNRIENLEAMTSEEHGAVHHGGDDNRHHNPEWLKSCQEDGMGQEEMADEVGVSQPTIHYHLSKHGLI